MSKQDGMVLALGNKYEECRALVFSKLQYRKGYTADELKRILIGVYAKLFTIRQMSTYKPTLRDYVALDITLYQKGSRHFVNVKQKGHSIDISLLHSKETVIEKETIKMNALDTIIELYLHIVNDWVNQKGRSNTGDYLRAVEKLSTLLDVSKDDSSGMDRLLSMIDKAEDKLQRNS